MITVFIEMSASCEARSSPQVGLVRSMLDSQFMFGFLSAESVGGVVERDVAKTVVEGWAAYKETRAAPRPRVPPTIRIVGMMRRKLWKP
jgi:hypothetical protein